MSASTSITLEPSGVVITHYAPHRANGRSVLIGSAMGVPQRFYQHYAAFLAEQGFHVVTYDYRGVGASAGTPSRRLTLCDWADDQWAALQWLGGRTPDNRCLVVGHSLGGQLLGLIPAADIVAFLGIAAQSGYWKHWRGRYRALMWLLGHVICPLSGRLLGRLPGAFLGGEDIPGGIARDWARAIRHPQYIRGIYASSARNGYDAVAFPMRLYGFGDDHLAPPAAINGFAALYPKATVEMRYIAPRDVGLTAIGHTGFFRRASARLWPETADWLARI